MNKKFFCLVSMCITALGIFTAGCALVVRPDTDLLLDQKAFALAKKVQSFNQDIISSKGKGWIKLDTDKRHERFRIAWAVEFPDKIRITFLISANPVETIIASGQKITFISHTNQHSKYSYNEEDPNLEKYVHVPVRISEMILFLLGRFPVKKFNDAYFAPFDPSLSTIVLKQKSSSDLQCFNFKDKNNVDSFWSENYLKDLVYKINIRQYKQYGLYKVPVKIELKDNNNRKLFLEITHLTLNSSIKESVFKVDS